MDLEIFDQPTPTITTPPLKLGTPEYIVNKNDRKAS